MIPSVGAFHACNLITRISCQKFASSVMHCSHFHIADSTAEIARQNWCFKIPATKVRKDPPPPPPPHHDQCTDNETVYFNDTCYKLPRGLSWLLEPEEKSNKLSLPIKPLPKNREPHKNSFGVILEWKGVILEEDDPEIEPCLWYVLSSLENKAFPSACILREIEGIKTEQALSEILNWSDDPNEVQRIASLKEHIYNELYGKRYPIRHGALEFISTLINYDVPIALVSNLSAASLKDAVDSIGMKYCFDAIVSVQDVERGRPEPDLYELAAQKIGISPERCVVFVNTDLMTEAARCAGMRCVAVASRYPVYELCAADHVVRWLHQVSFRELQALADGDPIGARARARATSMEIIIEE